MSEVLFGVWSVPVLILACAAGGLFGYQAIGYAIRNPLFSSGLATPFQNALLAVFMAIAGGGFFWVSQIIGAWLDGDPLWWRVASRFTVWLVFCVAIGIGAYLAARRDRRQRAAAARSQAVRELGGPR